MPTTSREIRLASRPQGVPTLDNFSFTTVEVPDPRAGEVLVRNLFMFVDPYMRGRMNDVKSYVSPFEIGKALQGGAVGPRHCVQRRKAASRNPRAQHVRLA